MALADYFRRSALAVAQVIQGYDEAALARLLEGTSVGMSVGAAEGAEGEALCDLTIRLLSRLYPRLSLVADDDDLRARLADLALAINPAIELSDGRADIALGVGAGASALGQEMIYLGSDGWDALLSATTPQPVGSSVGNPFGAGAAACLGVAAAFRRVIAQDAAEPVGDLRFSTFHGEPGESEAGTPAGTAEAAVLVGAGAIGNAVIWALGRTAIAGDLLIVDHEEVELGNVQRYVLSTRADEGRPKAPLVAEHMLGALRAEPASSSWQEFTARSGYDWETVLVAVDSARARRAVQASLPRTIVNAWTQPGDLGISVHPELNAGACLACLYHPAGPLPNEDQLVADALGLDHATQGVLVRQLLESGAPPPAPLLDQVAERLGVARTELAAFEQRPLRALYVEGVCGGAVIPLDRVGVPQQDLHVPLAHQSALAGVLLAAQFARLVSGQAPARTMVTRLNVLRPVPARPTQPAAKRPDGACICQDRTFMERYQEKWG